MRRSLFRSFSAILSRGFLLSSPPSYTPNPSNIRHFSSSKMVQGVEIINDGKVIVNRNPSTGSIISHVDCVPPNKIPDMVLASNESQKVWSKVPLSERIAMLKKACSALLERKEELANTITSEMGKPICESKDEVSWLAYKGEILENIEQANEDEVLLSDDGTDRVQSIVIRDSLGVVLILSPWNFPVDEILQLALPALAAGNSVILKPSEAAPECGNMVVETFASILPDPNIIQIVHGGPSIGKLLVESPDVHMVAMTGSTNTGKAIMKSCSSSLKRLVLELGGKDPFIVFSDADLEKAANDAVMYSLSNTGQVCCSVERIFVDSSIEKEFSTKVVDLASGYKVGDGQDPNVKVGPLVSRLQRDKVADQVDSAIKSGAKLIYQSDIPTVSKPDSDDYNEYSSYYPVTVVSHKQNVIILELRFFFHF